MSEQFYLPGRNGQREGPFTLLDMMRKVRSGKITEHSPVLRGSSASPEPAMAIPELNELLRDAHQHPVRHTQQLTLAAALAAGWRFVASHQLACAYSGGLVMVSYMLLRPVYARDPVTGLAATYLLYHLLYVFSAACLLRLSRGQNLTADFFIRTLLPASVPLAAAAAMIAPLSAVGLMFVLVPGILLLTLFSFVPFLLIDMRGHLLQAVKQSFQLSTRGSSDTLGVLFTLAAIHFVGSATVVLIPLVAPFIAGALAEIYDQLAISAPSS